MNCGTLDLLRGSRQILGLSKSAPSEACLNGMPQIADPACCTAPSPQCTINWALMITNIFLRYIQSIGNYCGPDSGWTRQLACLQLHKPLPQLVWRITLIVGAADVLLMAKTLRHRIYQDPTIYGSIVYIRVMQDLYHQQRLQVRYKVPKLPVPRPSLPGLVGWARLRPCGRGAVKRPVGCSCTRSISTSLQ